MKRTIFTILFVLSISMLLIGCNEKVEMIEEESVVDKDSGAVLMSDEERIAMEKEKGLKPLNNNNNNNNNNNIKQPDNNGPVNVDAPNTGGARPWEMNLYLLKSNEDNFFNKDERILVVEGGAVPNLLLTSDERLIATFQYFSQDDKTMFDKISYSISEDFGNTWSEPQLIDFSGLPEPELNIVPHHGSPVDPSLVQLDDGSFRLYFTYAKEGESNLRFSSAKADSINEVFEYEEGARLESDDLFILDPTVVYFNGEWHHYTTVHSQIENEEGEVNLHSVSSDGLNFERQDDIILDVTMLGGAVVTNENKLLFFGSALQGISSVATSGDGYNWEMDESFSKIGSDPGVVQLEDGTFLVLTQSKD